MDLTDYSVILTAYVVASAIKGLTGLGFSTSCLPVMALHFDLKTAIPLVIVPSIISNITVIVQAGHFREAMTRFWPLYLAAVPGLLVGLAVLVTINADAAKAILGLVLIIYALWAMTNTTFFSANQMGAGAADSHRFHDRRCQRHDRLPGHADPSLSLVAQPG
jgi:uncharacterized protein